ncbi:hypothetical protein B0H15DRAFT_806464 [Mycena belliarum]|uniref:CxC2-like cysteine cluster KDZ transposase-associated domain-containing protein n=1 Tax=Mycena belliarum TaxID=1033014 RepID=A0AAD6XJ13_9AGAR|nr:hypothetical protein B0H15DRAFT_806464 [Mycena belliae]
MFLRGGRAKRKEAEDSKRHISQNVLDTSNEVLYESIDASGSSSKRIKLSDPEPIHVVLEEKRPVESPIGSADESTKSITHNAQIIADFERWRVRLGDHLLSHEADVRLGTPCDCASGAVREATCHDCTQYPASCRDCFVNDHKYNPFHWVLLWDFKLGFYTRTDMSMIGPPLHLGHDGKMCSKVVQLSEPEVVARSFTIGHTNGIHRTKVQFCLHTDDHAVDALMHARLFPATFDRPATAFTFQVMKEFQIHSLESKQSAYDYCGSLMRLSDNAFTAENVADTYQNFIRADRLWADLATEKRLGHKHGVDAIFPYRPQGNKIVYCPACPEPGFNMDPKLPRHLPEEYKHLNQERLTADGNFHCNKAKKTDKNSDPNDTSIYAGKAQFPTRAAQREYLEKAPKSQEASGGSTLVKLRLTPVNNQDKKKFKNMEVTGIVNIQCSHVFIKASVDLEFGERFVNVDLALAHALRQRIGSGAEGKFKLSVDLDTQSIDRVLSYDIACQYHIKIVERFRQSFPDLVWIVEKMRWAVPALHVTGHADRCTYAYSTAYMVATGHFHGETAEHYWPELNQIGPKVRQMNYGHRQDIIVNNHNDWNHKKMSKIVVSLVDELEEARAKFTAFEAHFFGLCENLVDRAEKEDWWTRDRKTKRVAARAVSSVYMHDPLMKGDQMLSDEAMIGQGDAEEIVGKTASVLNEGILIQETQATIREAVNRFKTQPLAALDKEIKTRRAKAVKRIALWRGQQAAVMPGITADLLNRSACPVEDEVLFLPSDFDNEGRRVRGLTLLGLDEAKLREGAAYDALKSVQLVTKALVALSDRKKKNESGQNQQTAALKQIVDTEGRRDKHIRSYGAARAALIALGACTGEADDFPALSLEDTYMKSRRATRALGSSRNRDGWATSGVMANGRVRRPANSSSSSARVPRVRTQGAGTAMQPRRAGGNSARRVLEPAGARKTTEERARKTGWVWTFGRMGKMSAEEMKAWSAEGDRVQWFRAEADMHRWQEQMEQRLADLRTTIRSFATYKTGWAQMASQQESEKLGHIAYAKKKAHMFGTREEAARAALLRYPEYAHLEQDDADLMEFVRAERTARACELAAVVSLAKVRRVDTEAQAGASDSESSEDE